MARSRAIASEEPLEIRPGRMLPGTKYRVVRKIGEGGMAVVYEVAKGDAVRGAAKILSHALSGDRVYVERFRKEPTILGQIAHPNIVGVIDVDDLADGRPFFVMELLKGKALDIALRDQSTLPPRIALRVMQQLLAALQCAHTHTTPLVHRDVKPGNIFLHKPTHGDSILKLLDFGISSALNKKTVMAGTHGYMAPEQLQAHALTAQTDIYASAVVLFELLSGHGPFPRHEAMGFASLQYATLEVPAPRITRFAPWVPEPVADAIAMALEKDPARRPSSAVAFAEALRPLDAVDGASVGRSDAWTPAPTNASFTAIVLSPSSGPNLVADEVPRVEGPHIDTPSSHAQRVQRQREAARWRWVAAGILVVSACVSSAIVLVALRRSSAGSGPGRRDVTPSAVAAPAAAPPPSTVVASPEEAPEPSTISARTRIDTKTLTTGRSPVRPVSAPSARSAPSTHQAPGPPPAQPTSSADAIRSL